MDRRHFIVAGLGAGTVVGAGLLLPPGQPILRRLLGGSAIVVPEHLRLGSDAYAVLAGLRGTDALALAYLEQNPDSAETLDDWMLERLSLDPQQPPTSSDFVQRLRAAVQDDFANDRLCDANDWWLSQTECRAAALRYRVFGATPERGDDEYREGVIVEVQDWGPRSTEQGVPVNVQSDGHSGLWFLAAGAPPWLRLEIDGSRAAVEVSERNFTSGLFGAMQERILAQPGRYPVVLVDDMARIRQPLGDFEVKQRFERAQLAEGGTARDLCPVSEWGPQETQVGVVVNEQPDGSAALWLRTQCAPRHVRILFDGAALVTTVDGDQSVITALLPAAHLAVARLAIIQLHDPDAGETLEIGHFHIHD